MTNATTKQGFEHTKMPIFLNESELSATIFEFAQDSQNDKEENADCQAWGHQEYVFPADCFEQAHALLKTNKRLFAQQYAGEFEAQWQEEIDNDEVNGLTLSCPRLGLQQKIYFYDLPTQELANAA